MDTSGTNLALELEQQSYGIFQKWMRFGAPIFHSRPTWNQTYTVLTCLFQSTCTQQKMPFLLQTLAFSNSKSHQHFGHVPSGSLRQCGWGGSPILIHFIGGNVPCFSIPHQPQDLIGWFFSRMAPQKNRRGRAHGTRKVWQNCFFFHRRAMIRVENWQETYGLSVLPSSGGQCRFIFFQNHQLLAQQSEQNSQIDIQRFKLQSYNFSSKPRSKYVIRSLAPRSGSQEHQHHERLLVSCFKGGNCWKFVKACTSSLSAEQQADIIPPGYFIPIKDTNRIDVPFESSQPASPGVIFRRNKGAGDLGFFVLPSS